MSLPSSSDHRLEGSANNSHSVGVPRIENTRIITPLQLVRQHAEETGSQFRDEDRIGGGGDDDDDSSVDDDDELDNNNNNVDFPPEQKPDDLHDAFVAKEAARTANCAGYCVLLSLLLVGGILAVTTYFYVSGNEEDDFETEYSVVSREVIVGLERNTAALYHDLQSLARHFPSQADALAYQSSTTPSTPPSKFLTVLDWEAFCGPVRRAWNLALIAYAPWFTTPLERDEWGMYSQNRADDWMQQSYRLLSDYAHEQQAGVHPWIAPSIRDYVWIYSTAPDAADNEVTKDTTEGPYAPLWQTSPPPPPIMGDGGTASDMIPMMNFNLQSHGIYGHLANVTNETTRAFLTQPFDLTTLYGSAVMVEQDDEQPYSVGIVPVVASLMDENDSTMVTGHVSAAIPWTALFSNILQEHQRGITAVVGSCQGSGGWNTFDISGKQATFLGRGDLHDSAYDEHLHSTFFYGLVGSHNRSAISDALYCKHEILIYPTSVYQDSFDSQAAVTYSVTVALVVFFAIVLFLSYDMIVRRQQSLVLGEAERSNAIVASLFPGKVARRLFLDTSRHSHVGLGMDSSENRSTHSVNLLNFMNKGEVKIAEASRPIAELFPEATVLFADIAGFTAWSSIREPSQVFMLLESIFQAFDGIAKSFGVFKVETVGDCYVAVCGVPEPNEDHATVMAQFARECMRKFLTVVQDLELKLGPDTSDLSMRFGLNSGPVTAGVLRGERARFQLFGDTVNTAARMESTGARDRIHLSEQTANILISHGRGSWVKQRKDKVQAKGKGTLTTYWLEEEIATPRLWQEDGPANGGASIVGGLDNNASTGSAENCTDSHVSNPDGSRDHGGIEIHEDENGGLLGGAMGGRSVVSVGDALSPKGDGTHHKHASSSDQQDAKAIAAAATTRKIQRLVDWNTELLMQLLKQVVARRYAVSGRRTMPDALLEMARNVGEGHMPVEEVAEIIVLPDFDERAIRQVDPETVILSPEVTTQCRNYVALLASMYRDNPFHNFEHASHVTMSVSKLLSRIVAPEIDKHKLDRGMHQELLLHDHTYGITSDPLTQFSVVLSALIHDVDHRGIPNFLLIKEDERLAAAYENKSVAEQNSVDVAWNGLMRPEFEELRSCIFSDLVELRRFRALLVNSVVATDIFDKELGTLRKNRWAKAFAEPHTDTTRRDVNRKATIVIEHLIQASDVAHTMQHWHVYQKWNERLFQEMYQAFLTGRWDKDPSEGWYQGELGFFDNYIIPLAKKLKECGVFGVASDEYLNYATENRREWASKGHDLVKRLIKKYGPESGDDSFNKSTDQFADI